MTDSSKIESEDEYEEWAPSVLKRWDALVLKKGDAKEYTAFLRFTLKVYKIPARVKAVWRKNKRGSGKHMSLYIRYHGRARTMKDLEWKLGEIREITSAFPPYRFDIDFPYGEISYSPGLVWERNKFNGRTYFNDLMSIGKENIPYIPPEIRAKIMSF